jgi:tetratricopeptide (TPR) repeat protein
MAATLNKGINPSQTGLLYNPQLQDADTVEKLFVVRQKQFEFLLNKLLQEKENSIPQHHLIIGQRGMGKTTLLKRMEVELHKEQYRQQFIPLLYREEQYNVRDLAEFWFNTLDALADSLQSEKYPAPMVADIDKTIRELSRKSPEIISEEAYKYLMDICHNLHRRPVLLIDNIGLIFSRLDNDKQNKTKPWALRKLLSENGAPIVISGGNTLIDSVNDYGMPFYDFFQIQKLNKLNYEEFTKLLINLATVTDKDKTIIASIQENSSRQRSLFELTGGSPRLTVMLFEQIAKGFSSNVYDDLEKLADSITPLYKARFEELPSQQQIIVDAIALNWDAISLNKLSTATRMQNNQLSPQLKRMVDDGWIETTPAYKAKGNAYFISERFFNIYYLIRNSSRRHKDKVYCLSRFLECFYGKEDLERISDTLLQQGINSSEQMRLYLALSGVKALNSSQKKKMQEKVFETFLTNEELCKEFDIPGKNFLSKGRSLYKLKKYSDAINYFNKALDINKNDENAWYFKGTCLYALKKYDDALACFDMTLKIDVEFVPAWMQEGAILTYLEKYSDANECFDKVIKLGSAENDYLENDYLLYNKGFCLFNLQRYNEALDCYNRATELNSKNEYNWLFKGECLRSLHQFQEALDCYEQAIKLNPKDYYFWFFKGNCLFDMQQYEEAVTCYNEAIKLNPHDSSFWNQKGQTLIELRDYPAAADAYTQSIEIDPEYILSKFHLIFLYRDKLDEMSKAAALFNSIDENKINEKEGIFFVCRYYLHKTLFELYNTNKGLAREYLLQAFDILESEGKISSVANMYWWIRFGSVVINLGCSSWLLAVLEEKDYNIVLSPYYTAIQAMAIEQQDGKKDAETYLNNQAVEISNPAKIIVEKMKKYLDL